MKWEQTLVNDAPNKVDTSRSALEIVSSRTFSVARDRLFNAWSDPNCLTKWWGPNGFKNTFHEFDFHPGGSWWFDMQGPDGKNHPNTSIFVEIVRPERIVFDHVVSPKFRMIVTFADQGEETTMTWRMLFEPPIQMENMRSFIAQANEQNFDRLAAVLGVIPPS